MYSDATSDEDSGCKGCRGQGFGKYQGNSSMGKVKSKKDMVLEAQRDKKKVHLAALRDICHLKNCGVRTQIPEIPKQSRAPGGHCKRRFWSPPSFHRVPNNCCKNNGTLWQDCQVVTADACLKQLLPIAQNSLFRCLDMSSTTLMEIMVRRGGEEGRGPPLLTFFLFFPSFFVIFLLITPPPSRSALLHNCFLFVCFCSFLLFCPLDHLSQTVRVFFCGQVNKSVSLLTFSKSHQSCVGTTPVLLAVGVAKTNRRKRHFNGKTFEAPFGQTYMHIVSNYSIFFWYVCSVRCFFCKPSGHNCVVLTFSTVNEENY